MSRLAAEPLARSGVTGGCGEVVEKKESDVRECLKVLRANSGYIGLSVNQGSKDSLF